MVYLERNIKNNILRRFFDRALHCDTYFVWELYDSQSRLVLKYLTQDTSQNSMTYNLFLFELDDNEPLEQSGIEIKLNLKSGHYYYKVYETSEYSLDPDKYIQLIEEDMIVVEYSREENLSSNINDVYY